MVLEKRFTNVFRELKLRHALEKQRLMKGFAVRRNAVKSQSPMKKKRVGTER